MNGYELLQQAMPNARNQKQPDHEERLARIRELLLAGKTPKEVRAVVGSDRSYMITEVRKQLGQARRFIPWSARAERADRIRDLAAAGHTSRQMAKQLSITDGVVRRIAKDHGIEIRGDFVAGRAKGHNATRIMECIVQDAEGLTADVDLIDLDALDPTQISSYIRALMSARDRLGAFIRLLNKEQQRHGEAADAKPQAV